MPRNFSFKLVLLVFFTSTLALTAQSKVYYKEVLYNGKPAKLNVTTGEFILYGEKNIDTIKPTDTFDKLEGKDFDFHIVKAGETLLDLSKKYGASLNELKNANNLKTTLITEGQKLRIGNFEKANESESANIWVVSKGETLYSISRKTKVSIENIKRLNGLKNNNISIGQKLHLK